MKKLFLITAAILFTASACNVKPQAQVQPKQNFFEDDRIKVAVPSGWTAKDATETVNGDQTFELPIGAVFSKGNYQLYLLTHHSQVSGITGGRFGEVSHYVAPWADEFFQPNGCDQYTQNATVSVNKKLDRTDLYFNSAKATKEAFDQCGEPAKSANYWYGSYFTEVCDSNRKPDGCGGYFLTYENFSGKAPQDRVINGTKVVADFQMTYALTYNSKTPNVLPLKGDKQLSQVFEETNNIVNSIQYK